MLHTKFLPCEENEEIMKSKRIDGPGKLLTEIETTPLRALFQNESSEMGIFTLSVEMGIYVRY